MKQTLALTANPTKDNSPVNEVAYSVVSAEDGVYSVTTRTLYNAEGIALNTTQKQLISSLSSTIEDKSVSINERNFSSSQWTEYKEKAKRTTFSNIPTSTITAETVTVDGFVVFQKDNAGITSTEARAYATRGMTITLTDGRGNATTTVTDIAGRTTSVTDAAGNTTTTAYDAHHDTPATITDALGNTSCYRYDERGRKVAEWGTAVQPVCFGYDEADNMTSLTTFRHPQEVISSDPADTAGDVTSWTYEPATGLELSKTYADNSSVVKTYDAFNRLATETDARGNVKTNSYEQARGLLLGTVYSDGTTASQYAYNHLGQITQLTDAAGVRTLGYNHYGEQETDSLLAGGKTHLITETRDAMGRSTGYVYSKDGSTQQTVTTGYGTDGRIISAGFMHGGSEKQFGYGYLPGSNLLQTLTMPCNMTLTQSYESQRDLLIGMAYHRSTTLVTQRSYSYDTLGRPLTRNTSRNRQTENDNFVHNSRSELVSAIVNGETYGYDYDNIGNRTAAVENCSGLTNRTEYEANELNQYTAVGDFAPTFDAAGNQTLVKTATGIWSVVYNAENRPIRFASADGATVIECAYDSNGRRASKKVTTNGSVTLYQRYIYRGYLQIATCDLTRNDQPCLWLLTWDPTQPITTRPLAICKNGTWFAYGWDLTNNICEVFGPAGYIRMAYSYSPYGQVTANGDITQPMQWSAEYLDDELALVYYNFRHYNYVDGRWLRRDPYTEEKKLPYAYVHNMPILASDVKGLKQFEFDSTNCKLTIKFKFEVDFVDSIRFRYSDDKSRTYEGGVWSDQEKQDYINKITQDILLFWNDEFKLYPNNKSCPCSQSGIDVRMALEVDQYWFADLKINVVKDNPDFNSFNRAVPREYNSITGVYVRSSTSVRTINHEIGHALGLQHPGKGIKKPFIPQEFRNKWRDKNYFDKVGANQPSEYAHTGKDRYGREVHYNDLMGYGENKREFYYDEWKEYMNDNYSLGDCKCQYSIK